MRDVTARKVARVQELQRRADELRREELSLAAAQATTTTAETGITEQIAPQRSAEPAASKRGVDQASLADMRVAAAKAHRSTTVARLKALRRAEADVQAPGSETVEQYLERLDKLPLFALWSEVSSTFPAIAAELPQPGAPEEVLRWLYTKLGVSGVAEEFAPSWCDDEDFDQQ